MKIPLQCRTSSNRFKKAMLSSMVGCALVSTASNVMVLPALAQDKPTGTAAPEGAELMLSGTVVSVDEAAGTMTIAATLFTLSSGKSGVIAPAKKKTIAVTADTLLHRGGGNVAVELKSLRGDGLSDGPHVTVTGLDGGAGVPFAAREIVVYGGAIGTPTPAKAPAPGAELTLFKVVPVTPLDKQSIARASNPAGDVAGDILSGTGNDQLFVYRKGKLETVDGPYLNIGALGSNGDIVGQPNFDYATGVRPSAFLISNGRRKELSGLDYATGINSSGLICGNSMDNGALIFFNDQTRAVTDGNNEKSSFAAAVNDAGQIAGAVTDLQGVQHGFICSPGKMQILDTLGGADSSVTAISASGMVAGNSDTAIPDDPNEPKDPNDFTHGKHKHEHAFLWDGTKMTDLGTLGGPKSSATAVNDSGQVVGFCPSSKPGGSAWAFLYDHGQMKDLNSLLQDKNWRLKVPIGITNDGQIVGTADYEGKSHAVILVPVAPDRD